LTALYWMSATILRPLIPLRLDALGIGPGAIGLIAASNGILPLFLALPVGRLTDRIGSRPVLYVGLVGLMISGTGYATAGSVFAIVVLQVVSGVAELSTWIALQAMIGDAGSGRFLDRHMSLFSFGWGLGLTVGPVVGATVYQSGGIPAAASIYAAIGAVSLLLTLLLPPAPHAAHADEAAPRRTPVPTLLRRPGLRLAVLASFLNVFIVSVNTTFYPLLLQSKGISVDEIGVLISVIGLCSLLVRTVLPAIQWRLGSQRLLVLSMVLCTTVLTVLPFLTGLGQFLAAAIVLGLSTGVSPPLTVGLSVRHTFVTERGIVMGLRTAANRLAVVVQPATFGLVASLAGVASAFTVVGLGLGVVTVGIGVRTLRARDDSEPAEPAGVEL
jgi:MFS family permease